jgi:bifunctional non-homologous end joining protein LigD
LRGLPIERRKRELERLLKKASNKLVFNEHFDTEGAEVFRVACELGCEGIVSKKLGSPYRSGRSDTWLKIKNPKAPAATRVWEEDWGR